MKDNTHKIPQMTVSRAARSQFLHVQAQTGLNAAEAFESAIELLYKLMPENRDETIDVSTLIDNTISSKTSEKEL